MKTKWIAILMAVGAIPLNQSLATLLNGFNLSDESVTVATYSGNEIDLSFTQAEFEDVFETQYSASPPVSGETATFIKAFILHEPSSSNIPYLVFEAETSSGDKISIGVTSVAS